MKNYKSIVLALTSLSSMYSMQGFTSSFLNHLTTPNISPENTPWFTGPLLAPSAHTLPPKHVNVEPYVYFTTIQGAYNEKGDFVSAPHFYSLLEQTPIQIGINNFMDCQLIPQIFYQFTRGERSTQTGDLPISVAFQILNEQVGRRIPAIKLSFKAVIPFGKFENLNPTKLGTDGVGRGSWLPGIGLNLSRIYQLPNGHFFAPRISLNYRASEPVRVHGLNVYGGGPDTLGTVYPGNSFSCDFAFEYTLTKQFVFALDVLYEHNNKTRFSGNPGLFGQVHSPSSERFSIAPALEYNWNINVGLIAGLWVTVAGRNSTQFTSGVVALNIYI